eukprot:365981-Chlamydomonas_euryale.AAC.6
MPAAHSRPEVEGEGNAGVAATPGHPTASKQALSIHTTDSRMPTPHTHTNTRTHVHTRAYKQELPSVPSHTPPHPARAATRASPLPSAK